MNDRQFEILMAKLDKLIGLLQKPERVRVSRETINIELMSRRAIVALLVSKGLALSTAYRRVRDAIRLVNLAKSNNGLYSGFVEV